MYLVLVLEISGKHQKRKERKKKKKINERKENIIKIVREVIFFVVLKEKRDIKIIYYL